MEGWKTPPPSSSQVSLVAAALLLNLGLREEKLHITVSLSHLPHENKQQLVEKLSPLKILNKDVIYGFQFLWNPRKFKECCEQDSAANLPETDIKVTVCARKWQLFGLNMQIICASFFPWVVDKLTLNILLFIKKDEDFIMTGIFNCSFFLYQTCQNITLWGFYFICFFVVIGGGGGGFVCLFVFLSRRSRPARCFIPKSKKKSHFFLLFIYSLRFQRPNKRPYSCARCKGRHWRKWMTVGNLK